MAKNKKTEHKLVASSESEEYVKKINKRLDIKLGKELRHFNTEEKLFLKNSTMEFKKTREKLDKIRGRRKELCYKEETKGFNTAASMSADEAFFITDEGKASILPSGSKLAREIRSEVTESLRVKLIGNHRTEICEHFCSTQSDRGFVKMDDIISRIETTSVEELHSITGSSYQNILDLSPALKELSLASRQYFKTLQNAHQAATAFHQALGKVAKMASLSKGPANTLSGALEEMTAVHDDIEKRRLEVIRYLNKDFIEPLDVLMETDVLHVKSCQRTYNQSNKVKVESVDKVKSELLKLRKKSQRKKPSEKYEQKEKQLENQLHVFEEELKQFRVIGCKKALSEERKRYCFVLDRIATVDKNTMEFYDHNAGILREKLPGWFSLVKRKSENQMNGSLAIGDSNGGIPDSKLKLRAVFSHVATEASQLSFTEGDLIVPISEVVAGWQYGQNNQTGKSGWFPAGYTEEVLAVPTGPMASQTLPASGIHSRPTLDSSHASLKRYQSVGDAQLNSLPTPDYHGFEQERPSEPEKPSPQKDVQVMKASQVEPPSGSTVPPPPPPPTMEKLSSPTDTVSPKTKRLSSNLGPPPPPPPPPPVQQTEPKDGEQEESQTHF